MRVATIILLFASGLWSTVQADRQEQIGKFQSLPLDMQELIARIQSSPQPNMSNGQKNVKKIIGTVAPVSPQACPPDWWAFWPDYCYTDSGNIVIYDNTNKVYMYVRDSDSKQLAANACQGGNPTLIHMTSCSTYDLFYVFRAIDRAGYVR